MWAPFSRLVCDDRGSHRRPCGPPRFIWAPLGVSSDVMTRPALPRHAVPRVRSAVLLIALALTPTLPAVSMASHGSYPKPPLLPNCEHFSLAKMAQVIEVSSLTLEGSSGLSDTCIYKSPRVPGHYAQLLTISVEATSRTVFDRAERRAKQDAAKTGAAFHSFGPATFGVSVVHESGALKPCQPGHTVPEFGPPQCKGDPAWSSGTVYTYAPVSPRAPKVFWSVGLAREYGSFGTKLLSLSKQIVSGRIR